MLWRIARAAVCGERGVDVAARCCAQHLGSVVSRGTPPVAPIPDGREASVTGQFSTTGVGLGVELQMSACWGEGGGRG